jgi:Enoyl-CoA hydratase/isomerase
VPDSGGTFLLPRLVGSARAMGLALLGEPLPAEQALAWGLIWRCVDDDQLLAEAHALAARLALQPTRGLGLTKRALHASAGNSLDEQLDLERDLQRSRPNRGLSGGRRGLPRKAPAGLQRSLMPPAPPGQPEDGQAIAEAVRTQMYGRDRAAQALGITVEAIGPGSAVCRMGVRADMLNGHATCHGGLIFTLADTSLRLCLQCQQPGHAGAHLPRHLHRAGARGRRPSRQRPRTESHRPHGRL